MCVERLPPPNTDFLTRSVRVSLQSENECKIFTGRRKRRREKKNRNSRAEWIIIKEKESPDEHFVRYITKPCSGIITQPRTTSVIPSQQETINKEWGKKMGYKKDENCVWRHGLQILFVRQRHRVRRRMKWMEEQQATESYRDLLKRRTTFLYNFCCCSVRSAVVFVAPGCLAPYPKCSV